MAVQPVKTIDAFVAHDWGTVSNLIPYMSRAWRDMFTRSGDLGGPVTIDSRWIYRDPIGSKAGTWDGRGGAESIKAYLNALVVNRDRVVLGYHNGLLATASSYLHMAKVLVAAANDWTIEQWLDANPRAFGLALIVSALPEDAAEEIRRIGQHPKIVGISLGANGLGRGFGHPVYRPIFEAASELNLPVVLQVGSDATTDQITQPVAGGLPSTFAEFQVMGFQPLQSHAVNMIMEGVFERFPNLRVLLVGGGVTWVPGCLWRTDFWFKTLRKEAAWMTRLPSEVFIKHFYIGTQSLEAPPQKERLASVIASVPGLPERLMYTSCFPEYDSEEPQDIADRLPQEWHGSVFTDAATRFFRWPSELSDVPATVMNSQADKE
jgi:predicted TIM-barrel fold metal-dependent hydrolase